MKKPLHIRFRARVALCGVALLALSGASFQLLRAAEKPSAAVAASALAHELHGTWVHVGAPGKIGEAPEKGGFIKLRTAQHWAAIAINPRTGLVTSTHGGTWRVTGNEYEETVDYGGEYHAPWMNKTWKWKIELKGDLMIKTGLNNEWHEVWQRVK